MGFMMFGVAYVLYYLTNHHPLFEPGRLNLLWIDHQIPFLPWTLWIYLSEYVYFTVIYLIAKDLENINKYLYSFFFTQAFSCLIFLLWPVEYPRELFPLPDTLGDFTRGAWLMLRAHDTAINCLPSLHVSTVFLSAFLFLEEQREKFPFFMGWGILIAISTLPTKQHYFIDVIAGILLSFVGYFVFYKWLKYRRSTWVPAILGKRQYRRSRNSRMSSGL